MIYRSLGLVVVVLLALAARLDAQVVDTVRGRVIDGSGQPVADERVLLHRVVGAAGANIAETQSDADGRFALAVDSADNPDAMYFLAARWEGELYIGEAFRAPVGESERLLQVGVPGTSASALLEGTTTTMPPQGGAMPQPTAGRPATRGSWLLFAVLGITLLGVIVYFLLRGRVGVAERRRLLAEVAELDLAHAGAPTEEYRARRAALVEQLRDTPP